MTNRSETKESRIGQDYCCDSKTELYRVYNFSLQKFWHHGGCYDGRETAFFLKYHNHEPFVEDNNIYPKVKYYNPRKGLEIIDGNEYNQMPETNSSFKEIQYEFKFSSNESSNKISKKISIELLRVFDESEMKQILNYFNSNKDFRRSRKIRFKE